MSTTFRYVATALFAVLMLFGSSAWARHIQRTKLASEKLYERGELIKQGKIAAPVAPEPLDFEPNFGPKVDSFELAQVSLCDLYFKYWYFWFLFVAIVTWGLFGALGYTRSDRF